MIRHFEDIWFSIEATVKEHHVDFRAYEIEAQGGGYLYSCSGQPDTFDISKADVYFHGYVKWDGCSNWHIDAQDGCMIHFCGMHNVDQLRDAFKACYKMTEELLPTWDFN